MHVGIMISTPMLFSDAALSRRLERAEGHACAQFAAARRKRFPSSGAEWMECSGAFVVFDGLDSPVTQSFALGLSEDLEPATLDMVERFFYERGSPILLEISPLAGTRVLELLCERNYRPIEISSVLYRELVDTPELPSQEIRVRRAATDDEIALWNEVSTRGWVHDYPEFRDFFAQNAAIVAARQHGFCFLAELDGVPGAAGSLSIHEGVALFAGAATVPELRRRGLQNALLRERLRFACQHGCDVAMMVAETGSNSQRNAERQGFRIAYTRTKWRLAATAE